MNVLILFLDFVSLVLKLEFLYEWLNVGHFNLVFFSLTVLDSNILLIFESK